MQASQGPATHVVKQADPPAGSTPPGDTGARGCPTAEAGTLLASDFIPHDARAAVLLESTPQLTPALARLRDHARSPTHGLPVVAAFMLGHLDLEVSLLLAELARGGFAVQELLRIETPTGLVAWLFAIDCALDEASVLASTTWDLDIETGVDAVVARPRSPTQAFAYDVVFLPANRVALVHQSNAMTFRRWLADTPPTRPGSITSTPSITEALRTLAEAPIRVLLRGPAIASSASPASVHVHRLRATVDGVAVDVSLGIDETTPP